MRWFVLLLLAGCVGHGLADRQAALAPFIGASEADLVRRLGVPNRTYEANGRRFLAFTESRTDVLPGSGPFLPFRPYGGFGFGDFPPEVIERTCETTFEVGAGRVLSFALRGNAC